MLPIGIISTCYLIVNFTYVEVTGSVIYPAISWDSVAGILTPLVALFASGLIFAVLERLNRIKLRSLGYNRFVDIIEHKGRKNKEVMKAL